MGFQIGFPALMNYPPPPGGGGGYDADAQNWIDRVEAADGQALETTTKDAMNQLFLDLKEPRTWRGNSITLWAKAGYILPFCGPRTIAGAMIPLQDLTASTASGTGSMSWDRKTGLQVLSTANTPNVSIPYADNTNDTNDASLAILVTGAPTTGVNGTYISSNATQSRREVFRNSTSTLLTFSSSSSGDSLATYGNTLGWKGFTRNNSANYIRRADGNESTATRTSEALQSGTFTVFYRVPGTNHAGLNTRLGNVMIGADLDLAAYEAVINTYRNAINAAF